MIASRCPLPGFRPEADHTCHVCGTVFVLHTHLDPTARSNPFSHTPTECPACDAPVRSSYPVEVGRAKEIILGHYGTAYSRRTYGTVAKYIEQICPTPEFVDRYLEVAAAMDYDAWAKYCRTRLAREDATTEDRTDAALIERARAEAAAGLLGPALAADAAPVRARLVAGREKHLAIFRSRGRHTTG